MQLLNIFQVAARLNVSTMTVKRMWIDGRLPRPIKVGKVLNRWQAETIDKWIEQQESAAQEQTEKQKAEA